MSVSVLGGGAFGTALAISLAADRDVILWARAPADMHSNRENRARLPGCPFPERLRVTGDLEMAAQADIQLLAVPMQQLRRFLQSNRAALDAKVLVACCKGMELGSGLGPTSIISEEIPNARPAILTGPSFAVDIARGLPTALTLACANADTGKALQKTLTTKNLRLYRTGDVVGAELGGALKNVIAIACGVAIGAGLGESARAALMTRGYAELQRLAAHLKADPKTLSGLSGFGDLALTCTSEKSRNYRYGHVLGAGQAFDPTITVEGVATAKAAHALSLQAQLEMPITSAVVGLINKELDVHTAMRSLLDRPLKEE